MGNFENVRIEVKLGWRRTKTRLIKFCQEANLAPPRLAFQIGQAGWELQNLALIRAALKGHLQGKESKMLQFVDGIESYVKELVRLNGVSEPEILELATTFPQAGGGFVRVK